MLTSRAILYIAACSGLLAYGAAACGDNEGETGTKSNGACQQGICGTNQGGSSGTNQGGGTNVGGNGSAGGMPMGCVWLCTPWDTQGNGNAATRVCYETNDCGMVDGKPPETVDLPALDENFYRCQVEPILDTLCSQLACHGVEPNIGMGDPGRALRTYHRGRLRVTDTAETVMGCQGAGPIPVGECIGVVDRCGCWNEPHTPTEWQRNFDAARGFALDPATAQPLGDMNQSEMLTQPLKGGGLAHAGIKTWSMGDADYNTILSWLEGQTMGNCATTN